MVTRTAGRLLDPRLVTTASGTSMPVAVLPASSRVALNCTVFMSALLRTLCLSEDETRRGTANHRSPADLLRDIATSTVGCCPGLGRLRSGRRALQKMG